MGTICLGMTNKRPCIYQKHAAPLEVMKRPVLKLPAPNTLVGRGIEDEFQTWVFSSTFETDH